MTCASELVNRGFGVAIRGFELATREIDFVTSKYELVTHISELATRNSQLKSYFSTMVIVSYNLLILLVIRGVFRTLSNI